MKLREEIMDFLGGEQKRPLLGLLYIVAGLVGFSFFVAGGGLAIWGSLR